MESISRDSTFYFHFASIFKREDIRIGKKIESTPLAEGEVIIEEVFKKKIYL